MKYRLSDAFNTSVYPLKRVCYLRSRPCSRRRRARRPPLKLNTWRARSSVRRITSSSGRTTSRRSGRRRPP
eukprot:894657-Prorocentrum_minimum.AAC.1